MITEKESLIGVVTPKEELSGTINKGSIIVPPLLQEKEVIPNSNTQIIEADEEYNGLSRVTVDPMPETIYSTFQSSDDYMLRSLIKYVPKVDLGERTSAGQLFNGNFNNLEEIGEFKADNVTNFTDVFRNCPKLKKIPVFNAKKAKNVGNMFNGDINLSDEGLNNLLLTCTTMTALSSSSKNLTAIGFNNSAMYTAYPPSRIQALPNYQDFVNAGWSIGY